MGEYGGYRIKIGGKIFPDSYMARGSWSGIRKRKVLDEYEDAAGVKHIEYYPDKKAYISFKVKEHDSSEHLTIASYFADKDNVSIEYLCDDDGKYYTAECNIDDITWKHTGVAEKKINYESVDVVITQY